MHRRLQRQLDEALGQEHEASPPLRKLLRKVDLEYRRADRARGSLRHALALLSDLLQRQPESQPRTIASPRMRSAARLFEQAPFAALVCDSDRKVTAWNAAAERLFGVPAAEAVDRELSMLAFPGDDVEAARARTALRQALEQGGTQQSLQETRTRAGAARLCEWTLVSLRDEKGRSAGSAALVQEARLPGPSLPLPAASLSGPASELPADATIELPADATIELPADATIELTAAATASLAREAGTEPAEAPPPDPIAASPLDQVGHAPARTQRAPRTGAAHEDAPRFPGLEADLRRALAEDELRVWYLPVVSAVTRRIDGLEAQVRWEHPARGLLSPGHFLPFAEETGLIVPIGHWLLGRAGRELRGFCAISPEPLTLSLNLSSGQLRHEGLLAQIDAVLEEQHLDPQSMAVELAEDLVQKGEHAGRIAELRSRGLRLCMDEFGTGACSLHSLLRLQFDWLKIDRSVLARSAPGGAAPGMVRTTVSLARDLGMLVVADGVETREQFGFLCEAGCSAAQGLYFSPPVDEGGVRSLLERGATW